MNKSVITKIANQRGFSKEKEFYKDVNNIILYVGEDGRYMLSSFIGEEKKYAMRTAYFNNFSDNEVFKKEYDEFRELLNRLEWEDDL